MRELRFILLSGIISIFCVSGFAQNNSFDEQYGYWLDDNTWTNNNPGLSISGNIIINGTVTTNANESLFFNNNSTLTISEEDTLIVNH